MRQDGWFDNSGSIFPALLATLFIYLKLTHQIDWSWWWVLAPIWVPIAFAVVVFCVIYLFLEVRDFMRNR